VFKSSSGASPVVSPSGAGGLLHSSALHYHHLRTSPFTDGGGTVGVAGPSYDSTIGSGGGGTVGGLGIAEAGLAVGGGATLVSNPLQQRPAPGAAAAPSDIRQRPSRRDLAEDGFQQKMWHLCAEVRRRT
jgi:hypothetical protein